MRRTLVAIGGRRLQPEEGYFLCGAWDSNLKHIALHIHFSPSHGRSPVLHDLPCMILVFTDIFVVDELEVPRGGGRGSKEIEEAHRSKGGESFEEASLIT